MTHRIGALLAPVREPGLFDEFRPTDGIPARREPPSRLSIVFSQAMQLGISSSYPQAAFLGNLRTYG